MRETKNIIMYGFLLFLIITGITINFISNTVIINNIKCLSVPVFIFTISLLFVKANYLIRQQTLKVINTIEQTTKNNEKESKHSLSELESLMNSIDDYKKHFSEILHDKEQIKYNLVESKKLTFLYKNFCIIDIFTKLFNIIGVLSFALCLLSVTGLFSIEISSPIIEIFSLCIMYFDFFILEDLLTKYINRKLRWIEKNAKKQVEKDLSN